MFKGTTSSFLEFCPKLLDESSSSLSVQSVVKNFQKSNELTKQEEDLVYEILYGCHDNKNIINVVVDGFYLKDGKNYLKSEKSLFEVIAFIVIYRMAQNNSINELGLFSSNSKQEKIFKFLKYFLNDKNLLTWMKDAWTSHFESTFVEANLLNPLLNILPQVNDYLKEFEYHLYMNDTLKTKASTVTVAKPFNLTQPSRKILLPDPIPLPQKEVRKERKQLSKSSTQIDNIVYKEKSQPNSITSKFPSRERSIIRRQQNSSLPPKSQSAKESSSDSKIKRFKAKPFFVSQNIDEPVKLNTAVVIKDEYLIKKQANEVVKKLESLESGEGNPTEFLKWQEQMRNQDLRKKQEEQELRKIQAKLCHEEAILAKSNLIEAKKAKVKQLQDESDKLLTELTNLSRKDNERKANLVKEINEEEKRVKNAREKIEAEKRALVQQLIKESEEMEAMALKNAEIEMKKKIELIQQIKAAESLNNLNKKKLVDLTSNAGHGLLLEMSIVELKERLELLRQQNEENYKKKHDEIVKTKYQKEQEIVEKLNYINKFRNENIQTNRKYDLLKDAKIQTEDLYSKNESLSTLKNKLNQLKQERENSKKSTLKIDHSKQFNIYSNQRKTLERERFQDLEATHERYRLLNHTEKIST